MALRRILFPVDFSDRCVATSRRVKALAERFHSEVLMLYVLAPLSPHVAAFDMTGLVPESAARLKQRAKAELEGFLRNEFSHLDVRRVVAEGDPAETIVEQAYARQADLILMPTRGLGAFRRYVIGSVTTKVLHDADCPVWTGVHHDDKARPFSAVISHVVCAVDLGPQSVRALAWASGFAGELNARITLVHVMPDLEPLAGRYFDPDCHLSLMGSTRDELQKIQDTVGTHCDVHIESGEPARQVVHAAATLEADLLVIGRSPEEGITGRLRANAYAIVGQSPCPVVSI